ncbi:glycosyltransferase [Rosettibacter firmus]|uniref:glycosyltransferase n=1 Tax=Rosettibacter firmus TaxID=3111522 RepID=UPI00336BE202
MIRTSEYLKNYNMAPKILDYVDLLSEGLKRRIPNSNFFFKWLLKIEYKRVLNYEKEIRNYFDKLVIISEEDKKYFCKSDDPKINVIENGVDIDYFHPKTAEKEFDIFFNGNLSYPPNIDATQFIVNKIYPELKKIKPDIRILIAGANPKKKLFKLSNKNIVIKGWIEDVREYYWKSKIFIAPMQIGTGLQNKLLQAMAMRIPCVASELTVKGLSYGAENVVLVAKTPSDYANLIIKLLDDDNFREDVARRGYEFIQKNYKWENVIQKLENIIQETINNKK